MLLVDCTLPFCILFFVLKNRRELFFIHDDKLPNRVALRLEMWLEKVKYQIIRIRRKSLSKISSIQLSITSLDASKKFSMSDGCYITEKRTNLVKIDRVIVAVSYSRSTFNFLSITHVLHSFTLAKHFMSNHFLLFFIQN